MWGCIIWRPRFTEHLHESVRRRGVADFARDPERRDRVRDARAWRSRFADGSYADLGTYEEIRELDTSAASAVGQARSLRDTMHGPAPACAIVLVCWNNKAYLRAVSAFALRRRAAQHVRGRRGGQRFDRRQPGDGAGRVPRGPHRPERPQRRPGAGLQPGDRVHGGALRAAAEQRHAGQWPVPRPADRLHGRDPGCRSGGGHPAERGRVVPGGVEPLFIARPGVPDCDEAGGVPLARLPVPPAGGARKPLAWAG